MKIFTAPPESALVEKFSVISVLKPVGQLFWKKESGSRNYQHSKEMFWILKE